MEQLGNAICSLGQSLFPDTAFDGQPSGVGQVFGMAFTIIGVLMLVAGIAGLIMKFLGIVDITSLLGVFGSGMEQRYSNELSALASAASANALWFLLGGMAIAVFNNYLGDGFGILLRFLFTGVGAALGGSAC